MLDIRVGESTPGVAVVDVALFDFVDVVVVVDDDDVSP
jgi:hypothetical protein